MADPTNSAPFAFQHRPSGPSNPLEYMVSGLPFVTASTGTNKVEFPFVTNWIRFQNTSVAAAQVGFTENGVIGSNGFTVPAGEFRDIPFRIIDLFVNTAGDWEVIAGLTQIPRKSFFVLTGALNGFSGSQDAYGFHGFGYNGLG